MELRQPRGDKSLKGEKAGTLVMAAWKSYIKKKKNEALVTFLLKSCDLLHKIIKHLCCFSHYKSGILLLAAEFTLMET